MYCIWLRIQGTFAGELPLELCLGVAGGGDMPPPVEYWLAMTLAHAADGRPVVDVDNGGFPKIVDTGCHAAVASVVDRCS